jgi:hypothetical protein
MSQFSFFAIFSSLRKKDFAVSITLIVSIIIKILIIISTSLISLSLTRVSWNAHPMVLKNSFVNSNAKLAKIGNIAWYVMHGLGSRNLTLPEGISSDYAFQSVQTNLPATTETRVTVDGLTNSLDCQPVELSLAGATPPIESSSGNNSLNLTITSPGCDVAHVSLLGVAQLRETNSTLFARFKQIQCDGVEGDAGKRTLIMFGNLTYYLDYTSNTTGYIDAEHPTVGILDKSTQLLCVPTYAINRVDVIRNGTQTITIKPIEGAPNRTLDSITAWDIMEAQFAAITSELRDPELGYISYFSKVPVDVDVSMETAFDTQIETGTQAIALFDPGFLQQTATAYYRQIGAIIGKQSLMDPISVHTVGSATVYESRLLVHPWVAQGMVALVVACALLTVLMLFIMPSLGFLSHNPNTLLDLILLFRHSRALLAQLRSGGASNDEHFVRFLGLSAFRSGLFSDPIPSQVQFCIVDTEDSQNEKIGRISQISSKPYHPVILHPASRLVLCLSLVGLILALELLLRKSNFEDGLGDIEGDTYIHYTWTVIPALVFGALAMAFSSVDFQIRSLAPYMALTQYVKRDVFVQLDLLDMTIPEVICKEIKLRKTWALVTTTAFLIASLFTTFSTSLFQELSLPIITPIVLQANQSFSLTPFATDNSGEISSLLLESNYSFPRFTYNNLAFPELVPMTGLSTNTTFNASTVFISTVIPAVRGSLDCRSYDSVQIHTSLTPNQTSVDGLQNPLKVLIDGENCASPFQEYNYAMSTYPNATYFGLSPDAGSWVSMGSCSDLLYTWGGIDYSSSPVVQHIAAVGCNMTLQGIDVNTTFIGTDLDLDPQNSPRPLESTVRNTTIVNIRLSHKNTAYVGIYNNVAKVDVSPQLLNPFFAMLVTSPWAIPISALGDPSANANVTAAIKFQHGIILAQVLAALLVPANETNATLAGPIGHGDNDAQLTYNATVTATASRRRVVQDAASTHILAAMLTTTLVLFVIGWMTSPRTDVLPRSPTSIVSAMALVAGGNILDRLPGDTPLRSPEEIATTLGGPEIWFWMGWGTRPDEEGRATGGENESGVSQFGIFVVSKEEMALAQKQESVNQEGVSRYF